MGWILKQTEAEGPEVITNKELSDAVILLYYAVLPSHRSLSDKLGGYLKEGDTVHVQEKKTTDPANHLELPIPYPMPIV